MFTVATWNSRSGLSDSGPNSSKLKFVDDLSADMTVITDYGVGAPIRHPMFASTLSAERVLVGTRQENTLHAGPSAVELPSFLPFTWEHAGSVPIKCLGLYAVTPIPKSLAALEQALEIWGAWLKSGPSLLLGDLNLWVGLKGRTLANRSAKIYDLILKHGFVSAYHGFTGEVLGKESEITWEGSNGRTHIDFVFHSADLKLRRCHIKHPDKGSRLYRDHSAVVATFTS